MSKKQHQFTSAVTFCFCLHLLNSQWKKKANIYKRTHKNSLSLHTCKFKFLLQMCKMYDCAKLFSVFSRNNKINWFLFCVFNLNSFAKAQMEPQKSTVKKKRRKNAKFFEKQWKCNANVFRKSWFCVLCTIQSKMLCNFSVHLGNCVITMEFQKKHTKKVFDTRIFFDMIDRL